MTVQEFINDFKKDKVANTNINDHVVSDYIKKKLEVKEYIPLMDKRDLCSYVIENSCEEKNNLIMVDSVTRYIMFTIEILKTYTNLEFHTNEEFDIIDEYDMLCKEGLLDQILAVIDQEYIKCNNMLNMMLQDIIENHNSIEHLLADRSAILVNNIGKLIDVLIDKVNLLNGDTINEMIQTITNTEK